ncbi:PREDICTED: uncharacterized protein LOC109325449 [Lupinus angustifolius]|uniref:uncharacterized protein LOC109325449 n=1 Tax=Lupinus angustifolius TaxID=3871 RepID=UPI00092E50D5|nr:PREDICTED: uncharacterized protein LOC109325449 [Lupinus angustifolius]
MIEEEGEAVADEKIVFLEVGITNLCSKLHEIVFEAVDGVVEDIERLSLGFGERNLCFLRLLFLLLHVADVVVAVADVDSSEDPDPDPCCAFPFPAFNKRFFLQACCCCSFFFKLQPSLLLPTFTLFLCL